MKMKSVILLVVAIGCGLVAMLGVQQVLSGNKGEAAKTANVLVAVAEIIPGTPLNEENTVFKEMPLESIPEGAVTDPAQIVEKTLKSSAVPGEFIMQAKLTEDTSASTEIPKGMRVVTSSVNLTKTHSGLIRPGDRVDILLSYKVRSPDRGMISKTKTILEFIEVFATDSLIVSQDQQSDTSEINAKNLSFLVTPEQAAMLKLAESKGEINLALRHKNDEEHVEVAAIDETYWDDNGGSSFGEENAEDGEHGPLLSEIEGGDVRSAIENELAGPTTTTETVEVAEIDEPIIPDIPMWKVTIYSGEDVLEQEVPLPLDDNGMTEEEAALAEKQARLDELEAELTAREQALKDKEADEGHPAGDVDSKDATAAPTPKTDAKTERPDVKKENENSWKGAVKRFLSGA